VLVVLMGLIKGSHFGAAPWDSYRGGLSTRQFEVYHPRFWFHHHGKALPSRPSASLEACWAGKPGHGVLGPGAHGLSSASRRTLRGLANDLLWLWRLLDRGLLQLMFRPVRLICLWEQDGRPSGGTRGGALNGIDKGEDRQWRDRGVHTTTCNALRNVRDGWMDGWMDGGRRCCTYQGPWACLWLPS